ncbi:hypothetical protein SAMN05216188_11980 [Lentzea xinjiangensis]|uniref:Uncharacterized protein n=1 Tax=Lentzea xinjiangensis TaxID=402600 RepID=A0A1H9TUX3_9PSEU|nr:hypothetical protein SAMN05216188_11980 [Lentzea xinjiangensis]
MVPPSRPPSLPWSPSCAEATAGIASASPSVSTGTAARAALVVNAVIVRSFLKGSKRSALAGGIRRPLPCGLPSPRSNLMIPTPRRDDAPTSPHRVICRQRESEARRCWLTSLDARDLPTSRLLRTERSGTAGAQSWLSGFFEAGVCRPHPIRHAPPDLVSFGPDDDPDLLNRSEASSTARWDSRWTRMWPHRVVVDRMTCMLRDDGETVAGWWRSRCIADSRSHGALPERPWPRSRRTVVSVSAPHPGVGESVVAGDRCGGSFE